MVHKLTFRNLKVQCSKLKVQSLMVYKLPHCNDNPHKLKVESSMFKSQSSKYIFLSRYIQSYKGEQTVEQEQLIAKMIVP